MFFIVIYSKKTSVDGIMPLTIAFDRERNHVKQRRLYRKLFTQTHFV